MNQLLVALPIGCGLPINNKQEFTLQKTLRLVTHASNNINDFAKNIKSVWNESVVLSPPENRIIQNRHEDFPEKIIVFAGFVFLALILIIGILLCKRRRISNALRNTQCLCPRKDSKNPSHNGSTEEETIISSSKDQSHNGSTKVEPMISSHNHITAQPCFFFPAPTSQQQCLIM